MVGGARGTAKKILQCTGQPITKNYLLPNANGAEVEGTTRPQGTIACGEIKVIHSMRGSVIWVLGSFKMFSLFARH